MGAGQVASHWTCLVWARLPQPMGSLQQVLAQISGVLLGKNDQVRLAVACLVAGGHLLIEDFPGVGKTTLAEALARSFGLAFRRVHFTSDLLPADLTGLRLFDQHLGQFDWQAESRGRRDQRVVFRPFRNAQPLALPDHGQRGEHLPDRRGHVVVSDRLVGRVNLRPVGIPCPHRHTHGTHGG